MQVPRYWREIDARYRLVASACTNCGNVDFPKRALCSGCRHESIGKLESRPLSGRATLISWTKVYETPAGMESLTPYLIGIIETEEGCRLTTRLVDVDEDAVTDGMALEVRYRRLGESGPSGVVHYGYAFGPPVGT